MSPALNGSSAIQRFEYSNAIELRDGITFDFYMGLSHILTMANVSYNYNLADHNRKTCKAIENRILVSDCTWYYRLILIRKSERKYTTIILEL